MPDAKGGSVRLPASAANTTKRPLALMSTARLSPSAGCPRSPRLSSEKRPVSPSKTYASRRSFRSSSTRRAAERSATNRPFALIRAVRSERGTASRSRCTMERGAPGAADPVCGATRTAPPATSCSTSSPASIARVVSNDESWLFQTTPFPSWARRSTPSSCSRMCSISWAMNRETCGVIRRWTCAVTTAPPRKVKAVRA